MQLLGGEELRGFESEMATYLGVRHVRGVASGTDALWLALVGADVGRGRRGPHPGETRSSRTSRRSIAPARPRSTDIRTDDLGPDLDDLAPRITPRTRAILIVQLHDSRSTCRPFLELAEANDLVVIEDCSHAHGATLDGRRVGSFRPRRGVQPGRRQESGGLR
jgi:dTDP-4-amino-4,6-dideoxygalactose transaminase